MKKVLDKKYTKIYTFYFNQPGGTHDAGARSNKEATMPDFTGFEWDEAKRVKTLNERKVDFLTAIRIFNGPVLDVPSDRNDEQRRLAIGVVNGVELALVYTVRNDRCRVITARRAKRSERKKYHKHIARRGDPPAG